ncbi:hypothetical protein [Thalassobacillus devorans]|nr:hypothetical protein [Thalassobacillus devorans]
MGVDLTIIGMVVIYWGYGVDWLHYFEEGCCWRYYLFHFRKLDSCFS